MQPKLDASQLWRLTGASARQATPANLSETQMQARDDLIRAIDEGTLDWSERTRCLCGSPAHRIIADIDRFGLPVSSKLCEACGLIFSSPAFSSASLTRFYQSFYHRLTFRSRPSNQHALFVKGQGEKIFSLLKPWTRGRTALKVLDIGAGSGSVLLEFATAAAANGIKVSGIGLEYSEEYTALFKNGGHDLQLRAGDIHTLDRSNGPFDVVILSHVLEHFLDPHEELEVLKRLITGNTLVYVEVPGLMSLHRRYEYNCDYLQYATLAHTFNFNLASLVSVMNRSGYGLLEGNELVEGVFALGHQEIELTSNCREVLDYLKFLERNREYLRQDSPPSLAAKLDIPDMKAQLIYTKNFVDAIFAFWPVRLLRSLKKRLQKAAAQKPPAR